jgi:hypothetical protein
LLVEVEVDLGNQDLMLEELVMEELAAAAGVVKQALLEVLV